MEQLHKSRAIANPEPEFEPRHDASTELTCLILDDDPFDCQYLAKLLSKLDDAKLRVFVAHNQTEARALCVAISFDVFLIDFWMGHETTVPFIDEITSNVETPRIIMISTFDEAEFYEIGRKAGAGQYISKNDLSVPVLARALGLQSPAH